MGSSHRIEPPKTVTMNSLNITASSQQGTAVAAAVADASQPLDDRTVKHKRRYCKVLGCSRIVKGQGLCQRHGAATKKCQVSGCSKQAQGSFNRMCSTYKYLVLCSVFVVDTASRLHRTQGVSQKLWHGSTHTLAHTHHRSAFQSHPNWSDRTILCHGQYGLLQRRFSSAGTHADAAHCGNLRLRHHPSHQCGIFYLRFRTRRNKNDASG